MLSMNAILKTGVAVLGLVSLSLTSQSAYQAYSKYDRASHIELATEAAASLFTALVNMRVEASLTRAALEKAEPTVTPNPRLQPAREAELDGMTRALEPLHQLDLPDQAPLVQALSEGFDQLRSLQQQADEAAKKAKDQRPATLYKDFVALADEMQKKIIESGGIVRAYARDFDPVINSYLDLHEMAWKARLASGMALSPITNNIIVRGEIKPEAPLDQAAAFGKIDTLWSVIEDRLKMLAPNEAAAAAMAAAKSGYFDESFRTLQVTSLRKLINNEPLDFDRPHWDGVTLNALQTLAQSATVFIETARELAQDEAKQAWSRMMTMFALLIVSSLVSVVIFVIIGRRVIWPLKTITKATRALAAGDTGSEIPFAGRRDEIGEIAAAVEVFRQAAIAKRQLEQEAEAARAQAQADLLAAQRQAEESSAERLRNATSGLALALERLSNGDLGFQIDQAFAPDFEKLRLDFNRSLHQLGGTQAEISTVVHAVESGSHEMASGANELSGRTEHQADSLQETAAALERITAIVTDATRRTEDARSLAVRANQSATQSTKVVADAEDAMRRIEQSSQEISNIISVIDEIAFQTNLLALNAGVEAARAGEAGKGFAVVAMEVRELASRSATAAKEIKTLIKNSASEVDSGVKLVRATGAALTEIGGFIAEINGHMEAVATSAREQSSGLAEVNSAVSQMDRTTQQNASMVEQSTAAAKALADEAQMLRSLISQFTFKQAAGSPAQALHATAKAMGSPAARGPAGKAAPRRRA